MHAAEFQTHLKQALSDGTLSRGERQALADLLAEANLDDRQRLSLRHAAFDLIRDEFTANGLATGRLDWLEDVVKLIDGANSDTEPNSACPSAQVYFSPGDACRTRISTLFRQATTAVDVCVFTITDDMITEAILQAHRRGVQIRIITDNDKSLDIGSDIDQLLAAGVEVRLDESEYHMHHKFAVFDHHTVLCGSYNWTRSAADHNEENIVVLDDQGLVKQFEKSFEKLWRDYEPSHSRR